MTDLRTLVELIKADLAEGTAGDWEAGLEKSDIRINIAGHGGEYHNRIANLAWWNHGHTGPKSNPLRQEAKANARRIARVPTMEAALIEAMRVLEDVRKFLPKTQWALPTAAFAKELDRLIEAIDDLTKGKT